MLLYVMGLAAGAVFMALARRRADAIRLRVERRHGDWSRAACDDAQHEAPPGRRRVPR
jgi:hypothetical protein